MTESFGAQLHALSKKVEQIRFDYRNGLPNLVRQSCMGIM
jgi:hypothetical protein